MSPSFETVRITSRDGVALAARRAPGRAPAVLLAPGAFSDHRFWLGGPDAGFAGAVASAGHEVWALDPRGHGASARPGGARDWRFSDWIDADIPAWIDAAAPDGRPVVLVGHSAGGAAVLGALLAHDAARARVSAAVLLATPAPVLGPVRRAGALACRALSEILGTFPARRLGFSDQNEIGPVMAQWMRWNLAGRWGDDPRADLLARGGELRLALLSVCAQGDRLFAPPPACAALLARLPRAKATLLACGRKNGFSSDFDHPGIVRSRAARREVWPRILDWLARQSPAGK